MPEFFSREDAIANITSRYAILEQDGKEISLYPSDLEGLINTVDDLKDSALSSFVRDEFGQGSGNTPKSIKAMRKLELVDYEPASDSGHFRFYPEGSIVLELLQKWADDIAVKKLHALRITTPEIYDWSVPDIRDQGKSFHERHYSVHAGKGKKEWVLRFAGDFGLFRMLRDAKISYRNLPMRIYELSRSFRYENRGELSGLRRLRSFLMPDIHSFTTDINSGFTEYGELNRQYIELADKAGIEYALVFRVVEEFYNEYRNEIIEIVKEAGKPAFFEILSGMKHYWVMKNEFQAIDASGDACQLSTVQLDTVDSKRYGIEYTDNTGKKKGCIICHSSIGSLERWIYSILENALKLNKPVMPFWIAPVQVRVIPVSLKHNTGAENIVESLRNRNFRAEIDDRNEKLSRKILDAETRWIPMVVVIGDQEIMENKVTVNDRYTGTRRNVNMDEFLEVLEKLNHGYPCVYPGIPFRVSEKVSFL